MLHFAFAFGVFGHGPLVGGKNANIANDCFGCAQCGAFATFNRLREDKVNTVTREDEASNAALCRDRHSNRAHAWAERGGKEAAVTRAYQLTLRQRLASGYRIANNGASKACRVGLTFKIINILHQIFGPWLIAKTVRRNDRPHGQSARRDENFGAGWCWRNCCLHLG